MISKILKLNCVKHGQTDHKEIVKGTVVCLQCHEDMIKLLEKKLDKDEKDHVKRQKKKGYRVGDSFKPFSVNKIKEWYKKRFKRKSLFLIEMYMRNGKVDIFTVSTAASHFEAYGGCYFIDPDMSKEDLTSGWAKLTYHQDFALPFRIDFDLSEIDKLIADNQEAVKKAVKPSSFKEYFYTTIIEKIIAGVALANKLRILMILVIITMIVVLINLIVTLKVSGMV